MKTLILAIMATLLIGCATTQQQPFTEVELKCGQALAAVRKDGVTVQVCATLAANCTTDSCPVQCQLDPEWVAQTVEHKAALDFYCGIVDKAGK